jgi:hypothetical protein
VAERLVDFVISAPPSTPYLDNRAGNPMRGADGFDGLFANRRMRGERRPGMSDNNALFRGPKAPLPPKEPA